MPAPAPERLRSLGRHRMAERGIIDISTEFPRPWTDETVKAADVVSMGGGDACPIFPGKRYEEWVLDDPTGQDVAAVRPIRDEIERRVHALLEQLQVRRDQWGYVPTGPDLAQHWPLARAPLLLETSLPGVFAIGDVRHGSVKRVASAVGEGSICIRLVHEYLALTS
jgi:hypothetical protein